MLDLKKVKKAYVIGIKGSGVVAVVQLLLSMGIDVTGSDTHEKFFTDSVLEKMGVKYFEKFSAGNVSPDADLVVYSTAYNEKNNEEFRECVKRKLPMKSYPEMVAYFFNRKYGIAVCGTHGKTTTSAMLAAALKAAGQEPSAIIGSQVIEWSSNALAGNGDYFVIEADEFQNKLRLYEPKVAILTSVDWDHPDFYKNFDEYKKAFSDFVSKIPETGFLAVWGDSADTREVATSARCGVTRYGFGEENELRISNYELRMEGKPTQTFDVSYGDEELGKFEVSLVGKHNVLNAAAVIAVCRELKMDKDKVQEALRGFKGTSRRFEYVGQRNGAVIIDDYGHHPEELKVTLKATREIYPERNIIAVFHPHSFSRTEALLHDFGQSFDDANKVIVLDIYGSARENSGNVSSKDIVGLVNKYHPGKAEHVPTIDATVEYLKNKIGPKDVVLCIGAGNVCDVAEKLKESEKV